jgi:lysophospholipase L1-like esterase
MKSLLCFGDSNTHGTIPMRKREEVLRFDFKQRWPGIVQELLGPNWWVIEEGLPGRTTSFDDPEEGKNRNALRYWQACLQSHRPVDVIVIMLGTNDLKAKFNASSAVISNGLNTLIDITWQNTPPGLEHPHIIVVTPTPIKEIGFFSELFAGGEKKSHQLAKAYSALASKHKVLVLNASSYCEVSSIDGIHLDVMAHTQLGIALANEIQKITIY